MRPGAHGRTNQFAVARQLEGLQEKFQVVHRDELAHALHERLVELEGFRNAWLPELLSLLLQLSDRPVQNSKIEDLQRPTQTLTEPQTLSWSDLNTQDTAFSTEDIWEEVDFAANSSDDDIASVPSLEIDHLTTPQTPITPDDDYVIPDDVFLSGDDEELIASIESAQFWKPENRSLNPHRKGTASQTITELQLARETIFMLQGLPTSVFWRLDNSIEVDRSYKLGHSSNEALSSLLASFTAIGSQIDVLRNYVQVPQSIPYMQAFCRGIETLLLGFDKMLCKMQGQYLSPGAKVSLLQLLHDLRQNSRDLVPLSDLISQLREDSSDQPTHCIDLLYNRVCMLEALGDDDASRVLAKLFFSCFKTYTRSIQLWMETGQVDTSDSAFFVRATGSNGDLRTLWHDWFALDDRGAQSIPHFLENGIYKVLTTGKSMVFLHHLLALPNRVEASDRTDSILDDIYPSQSSPWLPFSALVESAFDKMIEINHSFSAGLLRTELEEQCGLWESLDALHHVYLGKDLSMLSVVDTKIFELMDRGRSWDDKFLITELARSAFSAMPTIDTSRLVVRSGGSSSRDAQNQNRTVRVLEKMSIDYVLPWPIANIITQDAILSYRRVATFLMQIRRAKYAIVKQRTRDARNSVEGAGDALVHALHHHILWFLDLLYSHFAYLVIATTNESLRSSLSNAGDVDAMIAAHQSYMSSLENECLLSKNLSPIHEAIVGLLDLSVYFADLQTVHASGSASQDGHSDQNPVGRLGMTRRKRSLDDDSDSDEDEDMDHDQTLTVSFRESPYDQQMRSVKARFDHLINFVTDGLKGVARASGLPSWNLLAERLEWRKA